MRQTIITLLALSLLLPGGAAWGGVRTVGTGQSYATIQAALDGAAPGDVVSVRTAKTYNESLVLKTSGTSAARCYLQNDSGGKVVLSADGTIFNTNGHDYWVIKGIEFRGAGSPMFYANGSDRITVDDCDFYRTGGSGQTVDFESCDFVTFTHCLVKSLQGGGTQAIFRDGNDTEVAYNEFTGDNTVEGRDAMMLTGFRLNVHHNYVHNCWTPHVDGIVIQFRNGSAGTGDFKIHHNRVENYGGGGGGIYCDSIWGDFTGQNDIYNNLVYITPEFRAAGYNAHGINIDGENGGGGAYWKVPVNIFNNVISVNMGALHFSRQSGGLKRIKNNIIFREFGGTSILNDSADTNPANWDIDYNFFDGSATQQINWGNRIIDHAQFQAMGYNRNGLTGDAATSGAPDFRPTATSPCVDKGVSLSSYFTDDLDGRSRPSGAGWDMGPYEYQGSAPQQPPAVTGITVVPE